MNRLERAKKLLEEASPLLKECLSDCGGCDHSVNICNCDLIHAIHEIEEFLNLLKGNICKVHSEVGLVASYCWECQQE